MGFVKGYYVPTHDEIIDNAFGYARVEAEKERGNDKADTIKKKEKVRIKSAGEKVNKYMKNVVLNFPSIDSLSNFYRFMINNSLDVNELKMALGHVKKTNVLINKFMSDYLLKINRDGFLKAGMYRAQFYGRLKSIVKDTKKSLEIIKHAYKTITSIPLVKEQPTVVLIGIPNVGKSTFLSKITGARVEIKNYPFTTKVLQIGHLEHKYLDFQIIDSPGLLDRDEDKLNDIEAQTVIAIKHLANSAIFLIDLDQDPKKQANIVNRYLKDNMPYIVLFTKKDLVDEVELNDFNKEFFNKLKLDSLENMFYLSLNDDCLEEFEQVREIIYKQNKNYYRD